MNKNKQIETIFDSFIYLLQRDPDHINIDTNGIKILLQQSQQQYEQAKVIRNQPVYKHFAKIKSKELNILYPEHEDLSVITFQLWNNLSAHEKQLFQFDLQKLKQSKHNMQYSSSDKSEAVVYTNIVGAVADNNNANTASTTKKTKNKKK